MIERAMVLATVGPYFCVPANRGNSANCKSPQLVTDVDIMRLTITDLGIDQTFGTGDDTVLFTKLYADNNRAWGYYTNSGEAPIITLGHTIRFAYEAVSTTSGNDRIGNHRSH